MSGYFWLGQISLDYFRLFRVSSNKVWLGQVCSGNVGVS